MSNFDIDKVRAMKMEDQVKALTERCEEVKFEIRNLQEQYNILCELKYSAKLQVKLAEVENKLPF